MENALICGSDESTLNTPIGACSIKHCNGGCFGKKEEDEGMTEINAAIKIELDIVEHEMRRQMLSGLRLHGEVMALHTLSEGMQSPNPEARRALSLRLKQS